MFKPTMPTLKLLPIAITLPLFGVNVAATGTGLTGVGWWNTHNEYTCNRSLVVHEHPQLVKRPVIGASTLSLGSRPGVETVTNSAQIFKRNALFCFVHQLFADVVIQPMHESVVLCQRAFSEVAGNSEWVYVEHSL